MFCTPSYFAQHHSVNPGKILVQKSDALIHDHTVMISLDRQKFHLSHVNHSNESYMSEEKF
jgi:hypothetical protein